jgi:hypothetical protein
MRILEAFKYPRQDFTAFLFFSCQTLAETIAFCISERGAVPAKGTLRHFGEGAETASLDDR